jgi:predicted ATPase
VIVASGGGYGIEVGSVDLDADAFGEALDEGRRRLAAGDAAGAGERLQTALALWRGPAFADLGDDEVLQAEAVRLEELRLAALELRIEADLASGRDDGLVEELDALCIAHPLREHLWAARMVALYRAGRQAEALRAYAEVRRNLVEALGIEPGPELRRTEGLVLAQDPSLGRPGSGTARIPTATSNLPARLTRFVGRADDLVAVARLFETARLVTLVGTGGVGKTRLALEVADRESDDELDGSWFIELAGVVDAPGLDAAITSALGLTDAEAPSTGILDSTRGSVIAHLAGRRALLVVDNCEHLVDEVARRCQQLLLALPDLRILATSREPLGLPGEVLYPVGSLPDDAAVELFCDRARAVAPAPGPDELAPAAVSDLCERLDGLPLAIEMAAARMRTLSLADLTGRLDDRFRLLTGGARTALPRQQTLRAVVDWSYDLLFDEERRLFARLSVFVAGAELDAIEAVCADEAVPGIDVVDLMGHLVDKSLVVAQRGDEGPTRYVLLETLRQYAQERLVEMGDAAQVRDRHARWYRGLVAGAVDGLRGPDGPRWRRRLTAESDNLRTALDWLVERGEADAALRLVLGMTWYWFLRFDPREAVRWIELALDANGPAPARLQLVALAWHAYFGAITDSTDAHLEESANALDALRTQGPGRSTVTAALLHASTLNRARRFDGTLELLAETDAERDGPMAGWNLAMLELLRANAFAHLGLFADAARSAERSIEGFLAAGDEWTVIEPMGTLVAVEVLSRAPTAGFEACDRIVARARELELPGYLSFWLIWRGVAALRLGRADRALDDAREAMATTGNPTNNALASILAARAATLGTSGGPEDPSTLCTHACTIFTQLGRADGVAAALVGRALGALDADDLPGARRHTRAAGEADASMATLAEAACLLTEGNPAAARTRLASWGDDNLPAFPGAAAAVLVPDHERLVFDLDTC